MTVTDAELREHEEMLLRDRETWQKLLLRSKLGASARLLALVISVNSNVTGWEPVWLSLADLARASGLTVNQVRYNLDGLLRQGWLRRPLEPLDGNWAVRPLYLRWPE